MQMIRRNVELEARLIDDLLDLTRISRGKVQLNFEIVDAHTLLQNAVEICRAEIDRKQLALQLDLAARKVHLRADPARLQQIFWNLINNAVKFTPRGGQIRISTNNDPGDQLRIEVADTGVGIDPGSLIKIFDAFEQAECHNSAAWVSGLPSVKRLSKHTMEQSRRKARVGIKAPSLH